MRRHKRHGGRAGSKQNNLYVYAIKRRLISIVGSDMRMVMASKGLPNQILAYLQLIEVALPHYVYDLEIVRSYNRTS